MILTLTPNAALDRLLFVDEFQPGAVMPVRKMLDKVGGKGLDASVALATLGVDTLAITFLAGRTGRVLHSLLDEYGIQSDPIWLKGETRLAHVIIEQRRQRHSHVITPGPPIPPSAVTEFLRRYRQYVSQMDWVVAGGSLPPDIPTDFYRTVIQVATSAATPALVDSRGDPVHAILDTPPTVLKMNWTEFNQTFQTSTHGLTGLRKAATRVVQQHRLPALALTCGKQGILALTPDGDFLATAPVQRVVNAAGAGDAASAALAWQLSLGSPWEKALRWAAAVSAASVLTEGTADCCMSDIERLLLRTEVRRLP